MWKADHSKHDEVAASDSAAHHQRPTSKASTLNPKPPTSPDLGIAVPALRPPQTLWCRERFHISHTHTRMLRTTQSCNGLRRPLHATIETLNPKQKSYTVT